MPSENGKLDAYMEQKIQTAVDRLKLASEMSETYYHKPLLITYSGGKDSDTVLGLAEESGIDFEVVMSITTVEAPQTMIHAHETARRIRQKGKSFTFHYSRDEETGKPTNMHDVVLKKQMLPTRIARFCCQVFKEFSTPDRMCVLGVRAEESVARAKNYDVFSVFDYKVKIKPIFSFEHAKNVFEEAKRVSQELDEPLDKENAYDCRLITEAKKNGKVTIQPIIDWTNADVWEYIRGRGIAYNPIYDMGYKRVGCVLCPMGQNKTREREIKDFPGIEKYWRRICNDLYYQRIREIGDWEKFNSPEDLFDWWIERKADQIEGQMSIFDFIDEETEEEQ